MHSTNLVPLTIPMVTEDINENKELDIFIESLKKKLENNPNDIMTQIHLERYSGLRSTFAREVEAKLELIMAPYCESDENYFEFIDETEEVRSYYESGTDNFIQLPGGKICYKYDSILKGRFVIKDGKVYERTAGRLNHEKRTKKAKKMKALIDFPVKKVFHTLKEYAVKYMWYLYDEDHERYGHLYNPNAFWDWYEIGGRWPRSFLVKQDCTEFSIGVRDLTYYANVPAPEGYKWVAAARKKNIEWEAMKKWEYDEAVKKYHSLKKAFETGTVPEESRWQITDCGIKSFSHDLFYKGETLDQYLERNGINSKHKYSVNFYSYLFDESYICEDDLPTDLDKKDRENMWRKMQSDFIDDQDDETVLVSVDCHI